MRDLFLVRHAECVGNRIGLFASPHEDPLTARGRIQAAAIRKLFDQVSLTRAALFASTAARAVETARIAFPGLQPVLDRRLLEIDAGAFSILTKAEILKLRPDFNISAYRHERFPGGESYADLFIRVEHWVRHVLLQSHEKVVVVAHGGSLGVIITLLLHRSLADFPLFELDEASVTHLQLKESGGAALVYVNRLPTY